MIFTTRDIELLRLLRWCRYIDPDDLKMFDEKTITNLKGIKMIRAQRSSKYLFLTGTGGEFLESVFADIPARMPISYKTQDALRRARIAKIALLSYSAGLNVFTNDLTCLEYDASYFLPTLMRSNSANPWSNSRIAALLRLGDTLYAAHYVCPGIGELLLTDELNAFNNNTSQIKNVRRAFFFAGQSYTDVLAELGAAPANEPGRYVSYADAYRQLSLPVHLLSCDTTGSMQLRLMAMPDYRQVLTRSALQTKYAEAPPEIPSWDAMFDGKPFVMAADMDLRRIDAAIKAAKERGIAQIVMVALKPQVEAVLKSRYRETGLARVFSLKEEMLSDLGINKLYTPPLEGFRTEKGEVIDAPLIQAARKAGGSSGK